ncbi:MAG: hypothetical protein ACXVRX_12495, partial [Solirubrobacteraceae bacterium]
FEVADGIDVEVASPEDLEHFSHVRRTGTAPEFRITRNAEPAEAAEVAETAEVAEAGDVPQAAAEAPEAATDAPETAPDA